MAWELTDWGARAKLTINAAQVAFTESGTFPVLLTVDNLPPDMLDSDGSNPALPDGGDLRFFDKEEPLNETDGRLPCEIVGFTQNANPASAKAEIWVGTPVNASADTEIWVYWDAAGKTQPAVGAVGGRNAVWDANFTCVLQLSESSLATLDDSTGNGNQPTALQSSNDYTYQAGGLHDDDSAIEVAASNTGIWKTPGGTTVGRAMCIEAVVYRDAGSKNTPQAGVLSSQGMGYNSYHVEITAADLARAQAWSGSDGSAQTTNTVGTSADWHYIAAQFGASADSRITEGSPGDPTPQSNSVATANSPGAIGNYYVGRWYGAYPAVGTRIDHAAISNIERDDDWVTTRFNSIANPGTFVTAGPTETPGGGGGIMNQLQGSNLGNDLYDGTLL